MQRRPEERFGSADDMRVALERGDPDPTLPPSLSAISGCEATAASVGLASGSQEYRMVSLLIRANAMLETSFDDTTGAGVSNTSLPRPRGPVAADAIAPDSFDQRGDWSRSEATSCRCGCSV
jgi:hypothetical protein